MPSLPSEEALTGEAFAEVRESLTMLAGEMLAVPQQFCRHGLCRRVGACRWRAVAARAKASPGKGRRGFPSGMASLQTEKARHRRPEPLPAQSLPAQSLRDGRPGCQAGLDSGQRALVDALAREGLVLCERVLDGTLDAQEWSDDPEIRERQLAAVEIVRAMVPAGPMAAAFSRWRRRALPLRQAPPVVTEHPEVGRAKD